MSIKGQTHAKRAREFALKERRERKKAKKEAQRAAIDSPDAGGTEGEPSLQMQLGSPAEPIQ